MCLDAAVLAPMAPACEPARSEANWSACAVSQVQCPDSVFVFATQRGDPFTPDAVNRLIKRIGVRARFAFPVHAHMLRHACGYALANAGHDTRAIQDWLGHGSIQHTIRYTELTPTRFKDFRR
jgi:site-specific recombinase XerD